MAKAFRVTPLARFTNRLVTALLRLGLPVGPFSLLTVRGRKTGVPRTTPITVGCHDGHESIVSPGGPGDWVKNLRAARFLAPYCDVGPDSPLAVFEDEAPRHPVFRLERLGPA